MLEARRLAAGADELLAAERRLAAAGVDADASQEEAACAAEEAREVARPPRPAARRHADARRLEPVTAVLAREAPEDILGFVCEEVGAGLRIASVSERGLLGRFNRAVEPRQRIGEGAVLQSVNGVCGDAEELRAATR